MKPISRIILPALTLLIVMAVTSTVVRAQDNAPKLEILTPTDGQTVYGAKVPIIFKVDNFTLISGESKSSSEGHVLIWMDEASPNPDNAKNVSEDTFTYSDVPYGDHKLTAELVNTDNKSLTPPQKVETNFKSAEVASTQAAAQTSGFDKNTAIVILVVVALVIVAAWWYTKEDEDDIPQEIKATKGKKKTKTKLAPKTVKKTARRRKK